MPTLEWMGKDKVINHHQDVPYRVIKHKYGFNADGDTSTEIDSDNKIIHGDNLEALKSLLPQYEGKVKCIYIDPPYNTGNENWVYNDNVNDPRIKKWLGDVVGKEGEDLSRHDKWLCMMYPRLKLLQRLLADDGSIFISINSIESANLRLLCNEVFGTNNFVSEIACVNNPKGRSDDKYFATAHESILVYRKSINFELGGFIPEEKITKRYNKIDERGLNYREIDLRKTGDHDLRSDRPNLFYPFFFNKKTQHLYVASNDDETPLDYVRILPMKSNEVEGNWRWGSDTATSKIIDLLPKFMPTKKQWGIFEKDYLHKKINVTPTTIWDFKDVNSERGTEMFIKYLGFSKGDFPNPKPVGTIERILKIATSPNDIVLDSFAGSGTTAHAVLNINKADGGNRKFILIEMEDYADTITAERIKRVVNGYAGTEGTGGDFNFYDLGEPLLIDNEYLNENINIKTIREYIFYMETKQPLAKEKTTGNEYYLGKNNNTDYYFYYKKDELTTLNYKFLATILKMAEGYIIYADSNALSKEELTKLNIVFKKIPRDIIRL